MRPNRLAALLAIVIWGGVTLPAWAETRGVPQAREAAVSVQSARSSEAVLPEQLRDFDAHVESVRRQFDVPGIAVAIIKDGKVVLERGYGVRERVHALQLEVCALREVFADPADQVHFGRHCTAAGVPYKSLVERIAYPLYALFVAANQYHVEPAR